MNKPIIGISGSVIIDNGGIFPGYHRSYVNEDYVDSVVQNGGVPYIIPFTEDDEVIREQLNHVQGLILSMRLLKLAEENGIPVLGICRGAQIINVAHGGTLYQDLSYRKELTLKHMQGHTNAK